MPAYKYTLKRGKTTRWRAKFYVTDWTGAKKQICKRGFKTQREAKEFEHSFLDQQNNTSDILFSSLVENYLEDMSHRLKLTSIENKRFNLKTVYNQLSAIMNYAVVHYRLSANPCRTAGSIGKSRAKEMNIWMQVQYEQFSAAIQ